MNVVNIHEAKTHLSKLVEKAAQGESFVIAKAGKPMVKVVALDAPQNEKAKATGFHEGTVLCSGRLRQNVRKRDRADVLR